MASPKRAPRKMKQPDSCGLGPALHVIGGKWKALLLWRIEQKPLRFGELKRLVPGVSEKMLIQHLRELEQDGLVHRKVFDVVPPHVEYSVTELGASLNVALTPLADWGKRYSERSNQRTELLPAA